MLRDNEWIANQYALLSRLAVNDLRSHRVWAGTNLYAVVSGTSTESYGKKDLRELFNFSDANSYVIRCIVKRLPLDTKVLCSILEVDSQPFELIDTSSIETTVSTYCFATKLEHSSEIALRLYANYQMLKQGKGFILYTWRTVEEARTNFQRYEFVLNKCTVLYNGRKVIHDLY